MDVWYKRLNICTIRGKRTGLKISGTTVQGCFDAVNFKDYFETMLVPYFQRMGSGPKVVICDNLASHKAVEFIEYCYMR